MLPLALVSLAALPRLSVPGPERAIVARAFGLAQVTIVRDSRPNPSLDEVRRESERTLALVAMDWLSERSRGCQAFVTEENDGALHAAELFELLAQLSPDRASLWSYWNLYGRWLHVHRFPEAAKERALAHQLDAFVETEVAAGHADRPETEWAARLAIMTWELASN